VSLAWKMFVAVKIYRTQVVEKNETHFMRNVLFSTYSVFEKMKFKAADSSRELYSA
jgi:hypothetical protein